MPAIRSCTVSVSPVGGVGHMKSRQSDGTLTMKASALIFMVSQDWLIGKRGKSLSRRLKYLTPCIADGICAAQIELIGVVF